MPGGPGSERCPPPHSSSHTVVLDTTRPRLLPRPVVGPEGRAGALTALRVPLGGTACSAVSSAPNAGPARSTVV